MTTFQAVAVTLLAVLPGASYTFAFERVAGAYGASLSDRLIRFAAASAVFHALFSGPELLLYRGLVVSGRLERAEIAAWQFELLALAYVLLPTAAGSVVGHGRNKRWPWVTWLTGTSPEPRAWDYLWTQPGKTMVVRLRLKSGPLVAGFFGKVEGAPASYAAGYPEAQDLFLGLQVKVDAVNGEFVKDDEGRIQPVEGRTSLLVRWEEVEYADVLEV
ncbi:DUF6338 family protein [Blastococcus sp. BMG 814]|uniref:DUF6338 family protein n=1 Tax=Blastococcus carthaginiensis TaxID=3050034 RepID=A0ABT9IBQ0_9ACTN|nr:DUF6338 family protein [Blastococcus carthaginiensis]MDP5182988.1 DUF6338 family protein [Blastococcus carthaginiensis]